MISAKWQISKGKKQLDEFGKKGKDKTTYHIFIYFTIVHFIHDDRLYEKYRAYLTHRLLF